MEPLPADALAWHCDEAALGFQNCAELQPFEGFIGQDRAIEAIGLALSIPHHGYNVYALGPEGIGKHTTVARLLHQAAEAGPPPKDLCYINNFASPHKPARLFLAAGRGRLFQQEMAEFTTDVMDAIKNAFENDEYRSKRQLIEEEIKDIQEQLIAGVEAEANAMDVALIRSPTGLAFAPMHEGRNLDSETFQALEAAEKKAIEEKVEALQKTLRERLSTMPAATREGRERIRKLNDQTAAFAVDFLIRSIAEKHRDEAAITTFLGEVRKDIVDKVEALLAGLQAEGPNPPPDMHPILKRYLVNLMVDHSGETKRQVVVEDDPSFERLFGRIEHRAEMGALVTDTGMIRAGALHRANGGYLVLDARKLLSMPLAYEALKRALNAGQIRMQPPSQMMGAVGAQTLEPEPVELDIKVVIVGERQYYYALAAQDPEFNRLFKVAADFDEVIDRTDESALLVARLLAGVCRDDGIGSLTSCGVARLLEEATRQAGDQQKLSIDLESLKDLLREAEYQHRNSGSGSIDREAVHAAIDARTRRLDRIRERSQEQIEMGTVAIATNGDATGSVNGLSVLQIGAFSFGKPTRITARVRVGAGQLVDIEREAKLGGPLHTKGVMILSGLLASRFTPETPLSLRASLVFEQSYGGVDGDSASSTEYYALISALADAPISQGFAVTGSIDQYGNVQAIGGVNEKIEGFFDLCAARGLTGKQGVLIPQSNVRHLGLHSRVRDAVAKGQFRIFAVDHVDQGIEILTGLQAGSVTKQGGFDKNSINERVRQRLIELADQRRKFGASPNDAKTASEADGVG